MKHERLTCGTLSGGGSVFPHTICTELMNTSFDIVIHLAVPWEGKGWTCHALFNRLTEPNLPLLWISYPMGS